MATNFPVSLDSLSNPTATDKQNNPDHATQHANANDAIEALQIKVGIDSSAVTTSHDYKLSTITGSDKVQPQSTAVTLTGAQTLTNKKITKRVQSEASSATPTPDADSYDVYTLTALAANATFAAPSGTPTDAQTLIVRIKDNGTARTLAWNTIYRDGDLTLPTTTIVNQTMYLGFIYNDADEKWDLIAYIDNVS